jgi:glyoxylase-like metal-dependent hydrolase (beta-lactamase superfamily II)
MNVITISHDEEMANTYVVSIGDQAIIIDPANSPQAIIKAVGNLKVQGIFLTHGHYDHFRYLREMLDRYLVKCYLHKNAYKKITDPSSSYSNFFGEKNGFAIDPERFSFINDNDELTLGNFKIRVWTTKGHTDCSICLFMDDCLFSGDTLFKGTVGRTDLATSNSLSLVTSIKRLMTLSTNYQVYPGHGWATTINDERQDNFFYKQIK